MPPMAYIATATSISKEVKGTGILESFCPGPLKELIMAYMKYNLKEDELKHLSSKQI